MCQTCVRMGMSDAVEWGGGECEAAGGVDAVVVDAIEENGE